MTRNVFQQYTGPLTAAQGNDGIKAAVRNGRELLEDAKLLLRHSRWARAAALSVLAMEEFGKVAIIRDIIAAKEPKTLKDAWGRYRNHIAKVDVYIAPVLRSAGMGEGDESSFFDKFKQVAFYSDCGDLAKGWVVPGSVVDEKIARDCVTVATSCADNTTSTSASG